MGASPVPASCLDGHGAASTGDDGLRREQLGARWAAGRPFIFSPAAAGAVVPFYLLFAYFSHWN